MPPQRGRGKGAKVALIVALAAVVLGIAAAAVFMFGNSGSQAPSEAPAGQAQSQNAVQVPDGDASSERGVEYSFDTVVLDRYDSNAGDLSGDSRFSYPVISCSQPNDVVDWLNSLMQEETESAFAAKIPGSMPPEQAAEHADEMFYGSRNWRITYFESGIVCVVRGDYTMFWGAAHGTPMLSSMVVDLTTGDQLTPAQFIGCSESDLRSMAWQAADSYLHVYHDLFDNASEAFPDTPAADGVPDGAATFYLVPDGVVAWFGPYILGSFAFGTPILQVCDLSGNAVATGSEYSVEPALTGMMTVG